MTRRKNVTAVPSELNQPSRLGPDLLGAPKGQQLLGRKPAVKRQLPAVLADQRRGVHDLRLERVEAVDPRRDQLVEQLVHIPAGVDHLELARPAHRTVHPLQVRENESLPVRLAHDQSSLLAPVVAEIHRVDVVLNRLTNLGDIVVGDGAE